MQAILLNSGIGKRMMPLTKEIPKCLVDINGYTILEHQLNSLREMQIQDIIITTGPFADKIETIVRTSYFDLNVTYIQNERYEETNYIYSLWLAKNNIIKDVLLMHGDLLFEQILLEKIISSESGNFVLINREIEPPVKDFKGNVINNRVTEIGVNLDDDNAFFLAPLYKFQKLDFKKWMEEIDRFVKSKKTNRYAEDALNSILHNIKLSPIYFKEEFCMEVDSLEDLDIAKEYFRKK